jgi:hypothetical protein
VTDVASTIHGGLDDLNVVHQSPLRGADVEDPVLVVSDARQQAQQALNNPQRSISEPR